MTAATFAPRARQELIAAARWIARDNPRAALAFRNTVEAAAGRIGQHPEIGTVRPNLLRPPFRFLTMAAFPYLLVYNAERSPPEIVAVIHGARDLPRLLRDLD